MSLPRRAFFTLLEAAARWGCHPSDIAGWAADGRLSIVTGMNFAQAGETPIAGKVEIQPMDILPLFRRDGSGPRTCRAKRVRPLEEGNTSWVFITDPDEGLQIDSSDLLIPAREVDAFERDCDLMRRPREVASKYNWDEMYIAVCRRIFESGLPESQKEFVREMQDWFIRRSDDGDAPDESTIRRKLNPLWRELQSL